MQWLQVFTCPTLLHLFHWIAPLDTIKQTGDHFRISHPWQALSGEAHPVSATRAKSQTQPWVSLPSQQHLRLPKMQFLPLFISYISLLIWVLPLRTQPLIPSRKKAFYQVAGLSAFWMCYFWKLKFANKPDLLSWNWFTIPYRQHFKKLFWANYILSWFPSD